MRDFWEKQAISHGQSVAAVNFDPIEDKFAAALYEELVPDGIDLADIGCGNGRTIFELVEKRKRGRFAGFDFAENMVRVAEEKRRELKLENVRFDRFDATSETLPHGTREAFDMVIGKRVLINIKGDAKRQALSNIASMLRDGGTYIMTECFIEPLDRINEIRAGIGLERIAVKPFNEYLTSGFLAEIERYFSVERFVDMGSLYYFISRVFNAHLSDGKPDYFAPINLLASRLVLSGVRPIQGYAPEVTYVLKKR